MGEIAEGLINGDFDFYTGEYIGRGYGFPRTKRKSFKRRNKGENKLDYTLSKDVAYNGIKNLIAIKYKGKPYIPSVRDVLEEYTLENNFDLKQMCLGIQKDFGAFVKFINNKCKSNG